MQAAAQDSTERYVDQAVGQVVVCLIQCRGAQDDRLHQRRTDSAFDCTKARPRREPPCRSGGSSQGCGISSLAHHRDESGGQVDGVDGLPGESRQNLKWHSGGRSIVQHELPLTLRALPLDQNVQGAFTDAAVLDGNIEPRILHTLPCLLRSEHWRGWRSPYLSHETKARVSWLNHPAMDSLVKLFDSRQCRNRSRECRFIPGGFGSIKLARLDVIQDVAAWLDDEPIGIQGHRRSLSSVWVSRGALTASPAKSSQLRAIGRPDLSSTAAPP
ncbi:hypothetical protein D3C81_1347350 [compost metagenome]